MNMTSVEKEISNVIKELGGIQFKGMEPYTEKQIEFFEERYQKIIKLLPKINPTDKVLEVGLSGGVLALSVKRIFSLNKMWAIEHPEVINEFTQKYKNKLKIENIELKPHDLQSTSNIYNSTFDVVILSEVIEHLVPAKLPSVFIKIRKCLKKDGKLLITTPNIASLLKRINLLRGVNPTEFDIRFHHNATYGHIREYTKNEVEKVIKVSGFEIVNSGFFNIDTKRSIYTQIENYFSCIIPSLSNNIYAIAKKI